MCAFLLLVSIFIIFGIKNYLKMSIFKIKLFSFLFALFFSLIFRVVHGWILRENVGTYVLYKPVEQFKIFMSNSKGQSNVQFV